MTHRKGKRLVLPDIPGKYGADDPRLMLRVIPSPTQKPRQLAFDLKRKLERDSIPFTRVTAKTVSFEDLARVKAVALTIWGWQPRPVPSDLKAWALKYNALIETDSRP